MPISTVECCDCMDFMAKFPDKFFDLAIVDPPYGIKESLKKRENNKTDKWKNPIKKIHNPKKWDLEPPRKKYFDELIRISQNQIIWGANHFISKIPLDSSCWVVWDKRNGDSDFADCELAWTSFKKAVRKFEWLWNGFQKQIPERRIHPTQKPIALYVWLLENYAKPGDKILDTHMGSQSSRIAAYQMGFDFWGCEIDPEYFADGCKRFEKEAEQQALFTPEKTTDKQNKLFKEGLG
jgi:site-specific DNA-methyltransferase (adenine-specific)